MHNNSTVALGIEILRTKYRGQLSNVFQLDFVTNRIHINMPRRSPYFFSLRAWQVGILRERDS